MQSYFLIFGLSSIGLTMPIMVGAVLALVINIGAYTSEIMRAGIESIHKGQLEAADCLGLSRLQVFWHVMLLPAMERVYPSLTSQFVLLMLASSIMSQISAEELSASPTASSPTPSAASRSSSCCGSPTCVLSYLMRAGFWLLGQIVFPRRRKLGTPL